MDSKLKVTSQDDIISTSDENLVKTKNSETPIKLKSPETSITNMLFRDCENKVPDITSDLKVIWEIVTPIITLALGYAFGKSEK